MGLKEAQIVFSKHYRAKIACRVRREREQAVQNVRNFIKGFMMRKGPITDQNRYFVKNVRLNYIKTCLENLPKSALPEHREKWPAPPPNCEDLRNALCDLWLKNYIQKYCTTMSEERKHILALKLKAHEVFKDKRADYSASVGQPFVSNYSEVVKVNNSDMKGVPAELNLERTSIVMMKKGKIKRNIPLEMIEKVKVSTMTDQTVIFEIKKSDDPKDKSGKADLIVQLKSKLSVIELLTKMKDKNDNLLIDFVDANERVSIRKDMKGGTFTAVFMTGNDPSISKDKTSGHLIIEVVSK